MFLCLWFDPPPPFLLGFTLFSNHQRLDQCKEEEEEEEKGCPIPIGLPLPEENGQVESVNLSSNTQVRGHICSVVILEET